MDKWSIEKLQEFSDKTYGFGKYTILKKYKSESNQQMLELKCDKGHIFSTRQSAFLKGHFLCQECNKREIMLDFLYYICNERFDDLECLNIIEFTSLKNKLWFKCKKCGHIWKAYPNSIKKGSGCPECGGTRKHTTEEVIAMARAIHGDKYQYLDPYEGMNKLWRIICPIHGEFWQKPLKHIHGKNGCPYCNGGIKFTPEEIVRKARIIHGDYYEYDLDSIDGMTKPMRIKCPIHGWFEQTPHNHIDAKQNCPDCVNHWKLEEDVKKLLIENNIEFYAQHREKWLGQQSFDDYIPKGRIAIECQGIGHFEPRDHFGGEEGYKTQIERDERKRRLCKENGVILIYYTDIIRDSYPYPVCLSTEELLEKIKKYIK